MTEEERGQQLRLLEYAILDVLLVMRAVHLEELEELRRRHLEDISRVCGIPPEFFDTGH